MTNFMTKPRIRRQRLKSVLWPETASFGHTSDIKM